MIISVASGKGGTGKTLIATSLALSMVASVQLLDCDVEEPNAHIFLKPKIDTSEAATIPVPQVNKTKCTYCHKCVEVCAFHAIAVLAEHVLVFPELCHGCGACSYLCPENAISEADRQIGVVERGRAGDIDFVHGRLNIGEAMAPPLIRAVKKHLDRSRTVIIDVPPGTSCPVVESIEGSDFCVLVTEPTPFGLNDLMLAVEVVRKLGIPFGIVINRDRFGDNKTEKFCKANDIPILMRIPLDTEIARKYSRGIPLVQAMPRWKPEFKQLFDDIKRQTGARA